jgi:hypothetical protein
MLKTAVAGLKMAHLHEITLAFEFLVLTLTVPELRAKNFKILKCFRVSAPFSFSLTAVFRIINNFDLIRVTIAPFKADAPLIINTNTEPPGTIALQQFEPIRRRNSQVL